MKLIIGLTLAAVIIGAIVLTTNSTKAHKQSENTRALSRAVDQYNDLLQSAQTDCNAMQNNISRAKSDVNEPDQGNASLIIDNSKDLLNAVDIDKGYRARIKSEIQSASSLRQKIFADPLYAANYHESAAQVPDLSITSQPDYDLGAPLHFIEKWSTP